MNAVVQLKDRHTTASELRAKPCFAQGLAGHITARDPELTDHFSPDIIAAAHSFDALYQGLVEAEPELLQ